MITRWSVVVALYIIWNITTYRAYELTVDGSITRKLYDHLYYINERVFVMSAFWALWLTVVKKYKWIFRTLLMVAGWKLLYVMAMVLNVIKANNFVSLMGTMFMLAIGAIIVGWEKSLRK